MLPLPPLLLLLARCTTAAGTAAPAHVWLNALYAYQLPSTLKLLHCLRVDSDQCNRQQRLTHMWHRRFTCVQLPLLLLLLLWCVCRFVYPDERWLKGSTAAYVALYRACTVGRGELILGTGSAAWLAVQCLWGKVYKLQMNPLICCVLHCVVEYSKFGVLLAVGHLKQMATQGRNPYAWQSKLAVIQLLPWYGCCCCCCCVHLDQRSP
jgi:hypothetical protein